MISNLKKELVILALSILILIAGYFYAEQSGYARATKQCEKRESERVLQVAEHIANTNVALVRIYSTLSVNNSSTQADIQKVLDKLNNAPSITIKNGKCVLSEQYISSVNKAIEIANRGIGK